MGLTDDQAAERDRNLKPTVRDDANPEHGHGRGKTVLHQVGGSPELRGIPLIGTGPGGLDHSRPGGEIGHAAALERAGRDIVRGHLRRTRRRDYRADTIRRLNGEMAELGAQLQRRREEHGVQIECMAVYGSDGTLIRTIGVTLAPNGYKLDEPPALEDGEHLFAVVRTDAGARMLDRVGPKFTL